jgi:hypothetical protein
MRVLSLAVAGKCAPLGWPGTKPRVTYDVDAGG